MTSRRIAGIVMLLAAAASAGCTTLREIPRSEYASRPERKALRVWTNEGLEYEFDYATVANDTLTGYRQRDTEGALEQVAVLQFALPDIQRLSSRGLDWYRTGLIGGGLLAGVIAAGLSQSGKGSDPDGSGSGGGGGRVP